MMPMTTSNSTSVKARKAWPRFDMAVPPAEPPREWCRAGLLAVARGHLRQRLARIERLRPLQLPQVRQQHRLGVPVKEAHVDGSLVVPLDAHSRHHGRIPGLEVAGGVGVERPGVNPRAVAED